MKIYRDIISGDEMFSDIYKITESPNGILYEVEGKYVTRSADQINERVFGGNASAENQQEECDDSTSVSGVDIILNHKLQPIAYSKATYKLYIKDYVKRIKEKLLKDNPERVDAFMSGAQKEVASILMPKLKDCQFYTGESMEADAMVALLDYREDGCTPYVIFFKDGLIEEKC